MVGVASGWTGRTPVVGAVSGITAEEAGAETTEGLVTSFNGLPVDAGGALTTPAVDVTGCEEMRAGSRRCFSSDFTDRGRC